jgi:hypothetical protein
MHHACGYKRCIQNFVGKLGEKNHLENQGVDRRIILKCNLRKLGGKVLTRFIWLRIWTYAGLLSTQ